MDGKSVMIAEKSLLEAGLKGRSPCPVSSPCSSPCLVRGVTEVSSRGHKPGPDLFTATEL